jgi:inner membrane protein
MDSITQATLGAAIGEAYLGKKIGYKAALSGAILGTLPDLDIIANPFVDAVTQLYFHRGISHSFLLVTLSAIPVGWVMNRLLKRHEIGWKPWSLLAFWIFLTHVLIDLPTTYGTQVLQPITNTPYATDAIFIIDPLFTLPMLGGLIAALVLRRKGTLGKTLNRAGLAVAGLYLLWGHAIKSHVHAVYQESFHQQYGYYDELKTTPNGPTTFLWTGYAIRQDTVYQATYSIFDEDKNLSFSPIPRNTQLIEPYMNDRGTTALLWFAQGYYTVEEQEDGSLIFYDLRFGRGDFWLTEEAEFVWANRMIINEENRAVMFEQFIPSFDTRGRSLVLLWDRIWGK